MSDEVKPDKGWPKIPEIPVDFGKHNVEADLGILGKWEVGNIQVDEATLKAFELDPAFKAEALAEARAEVQRAFTQLILRIAAVALVNRDEGYGPLVTWYDIAQKELKEAD